MIYPPPPPPPNPKFYSVAVQPFNPKKLLYSDYAQLPEAREKELNAEYSSLEDLVKYASPTFAEHGFVPWSILVHGQASKTSPVPVSFVPLSALWPKPLNPKP